MENTAEVTPEIQSVEPSSDTQPEQPSSQEPQPYSAENDPTLSPQPVAGEDENNGQNPEEDVTKLSPRAQRRFQQLSNKVRQLQQNSGDHVSQDQLPDFAYQPGQEIGIKDLQRDITGAARGIVQLEMERERNIGRIANEALEVEFKYPELNPDNPKFNKKLTETVSKVVEREISRNPTASIRDIVSEMMGILEEGRRQGTESGVSTAVQKMGQTAVTPSGNSPKKKNFADLSITEMEKRLGFAP